MRAIWKGSISFSLVNIPISLYPATRTDELKFHMLRAGDMSRINYRRVAEADGKEVPWEQIVKGYEYEKGKFVILKDEDFRRVDIEATQTIDIIDFVELDEIDPTFFDKPYFLEPQKAGWKAYALLRDSLRRTGKAGIAKVVIKTRQHLAAVKPLNQVLVLELMHFGDELVKPSSLKIPGNLDIGAKEQEMALSLVESMTDAWDPEKYRDDYREALLQLIHEKVQSGGKPPPQGPKPRKPTNVIDLVSVLQESLSRVQSGSSPARNRTKASGRSKPTARSKSRARTPGKLKKAA